MKVLLHFKALLILALLISCAGTKMTKQSGTKYNKLSSAEKSVIIDKKTEIPYTGKYYNFDKNGTYLCKQCGVPLFRSNNKFDSGCGWPSFDQAIDGAVREIPDRDGMRTEIVCANCGAHLGHIFRGEGFTPKNVRHCVNSISLLFSPAEKPKYENAYFAGGCFWGVEYYMKKTKGVISTTVGYSGGSLANPSYYQVSRGNTGYLETVKVEFDPAITTFEQLARLFFEIHDPTQADGQGPDIGAQYLSHIFYTTDKQKNICKKLIELLKKKGYPVITRITEFQHFWPAESYHQDYYDKTGKAPYCHVRVKRF